MDEGRSDRSWLVLLIVLAAAVVVRVWGLDFGLPHPWARPDESRLVNMAVKFGQGDLNPPFFNYPTLYPYILSAIFGLYFVLGRLFGVYTSVHDFAVEFATAPTNFYLLDRVVSAIMGTLTVLVVFRIGQHLSNRRTAFVAAVFTAFCHLHVRDSHFGVTDVPMTFFIMASVLYILRAHGSGRMKHYLVAGVLSGLAASTKYAGFMLIIPMLVAHFLVIREARAGIKHLVLDKRPWAFAAALVVGFLVGTPYALLEFSRFVTDLSGEMRHLDIGHMGLILDRGWWHHLSFSLFYGMGWPLLAAALVGMVLVFRRDYRKALVLCAFPVVYYLWVGKGYTVFARYIIPVVPFLCVTAAILVDTVRGYLVRKTSTKVATAIATVLVVLLLVPSLWRIYETDCLLNSTDNRLIATEWIDTHIPPGASIYQVNAGTGALQLDPGQFFLEKYTRYERMISDGYRGDDLRSSVDGIVDSLVGARPYRQWRWDSDVNKFVFDGQPQTGLPEYIVVEQVPLKYYDVTPDAVKTLMGSLYRPLREFIAFDTTADNRYDLQDHFYVPLAGFEGVIRPGPNLYIYELAGQSEDDTPQ